jgi:hypothetical protein
MFSLYCMGLPSSVWMVASSLRIQRIAIRAGPVQLIRLEWCPYGPRKF